jgi:hypothetical protein
MQQKKLERVRKHSIQRGGSRPAENEKVFSISPPDLPAQTPPHAVLYTGIA